LHADSVYDSGTSVGATNGKGVKRKDYWKDRYVVTLLIGYPPIARDAGEVLLRFFFPRVPNEAWIVESQ